MGKLTETEHWEENIYQIETSDPVLGGPEGITNKPARQLASRTRWLKKKLAEAEQALAQHARSRNHPDATLNDQGLVQLSSHDNSDSETLAATPKAVKKVREMALLKSQNGADIPDKARFLQNVGAVPETGSAALAGNFRTTGEFQQGGTDEEAVRGWRMVTRDTATYWSLTDSEHGGPGNASKLTLYAIWPPYDLLGVSAKTSLLRIDIRSGNTICKGGITCDSVSTKGTVTPGNYANFDKRYLREDQQQVIQDATTSQKGIVQLSDSITSTSSALAATSSAVKTAYDWAYRAYDQVLIAQNRANDAYSRANDAQNRANDAYSRATDAATVTRTLLFEGNVNRGNITLRASPADFDELVVMGCDDNDVWFAMYHILIREAREVLVLSDSGSGGVFCIFSAGAIDWWVRRDSFLTTLWITESGWENCHLRKIFGLRYSYRNYR